jgi:hypothetical protein
LRCVCSSRITRNVFITTGIDNKLAFAHNGNSVTRIHANLARIVHTATRNPGTANPTPIHITVCDVGATPGKKCSRNANTHHAAHPNEANAIDNIHVRCRLRTILCIVAGRRTGRTMAAILRASVARTQDAAA